MYVCVYASINLSTSKYVSACLCMFMYMSLYVCVCLCIYVYLCMPLYVNVCLCMPLFYVCLCMHMCVYVLCMCVCLCMCPYVCVCLCLSARMHVCIILYLYVYHGDRHIQRPPPNIQQQQVCTASRQHPVFHPSCQSDWSARVLSSVVHVWEILPFSAHIIDCNDGLNALVPSSSELPQKLAPERFFYIIATRHE